MPAKKKTEVLEEITRFEILPIDQDFSREDLHILRDKINEIIAVLNAKVNA